MTYGRRLGDFGPKTLARFGPGSGWDPNADVWELYYLPDDFSQAHDIAFIGSKGIGKSTAGPPRHLVRPRHL